MRVPVPRSPTLSASCLRNGCDTRSISRPVPASMRAMTCMIGKMHPVRLAGRVAERLAELGDVGHRAGGRKAGSSRRVQPANAPSMALSLAGRDDPARFESLPQGALARPHRPERPALRGLHVGSARHEPFQQEATRGANRRKAPRMMRLPLSSWRSGLWLRSTPFAWRGTVNGSTSPSALPPPTHGICTTTPGVRAHATGSTSVGSASGCMPQDAPAEPRPNMTGRGSSEH